MKNKGQILRYAGRYARRPPVVEHRFIKVTANEVKFFDERSKTETHGDNEVHNPRIRRVSDASCA